MNLTKAEMLERLQHKVSLFEVPCFFYFTVNEFNQNKEKILQKVGQKFTSEVVIRSSSIYEDGIVASSAGEFESVLNIDPRNELEVTESILNVIESYSHKASGKNQIIIQDMLRSTTMSGVIFTHDLNTGAPYYVINYDDQSGATDTVTSGTTEYSNRTLYIHRNAIDKLHSGRFISLIESVKELEAILDSEFLDIEFALGDDLKPYLLQVRPITTKPNWNGSLKKRIDATLTGVDSFLKEHFRRAAGVFGETTVFGQMPDWNPVEMIGRAPRALAASLYKLIITDHAWRIARKEMGYTVPTGQPLMLMLAGQPYIDTRLSFHSYLPKDLSSNIGEKLVDHWVSSLANSPELHDKVEFDVAITTYSFDFDEKMERLVGNALTDEEKEEFKSIHLNHTRNLIKGESSGSISSAMQLVNLLSQKQQQKNVQKGISSLFSMIDDCINLGTIPFSMLARHGFIAKTILLSLKERGVLTHDEINQIQAGVHTVASELVDDMCSLQVGELTDSDFMDKYGHLRPGTYDIMSHRYDQMKNFAVGNLLPIGHIDSQQTDTFKLSQQQQHKINLMLKEDGFEEFDAIDLLEYVNKAIEGREYGKFVFSRTLSDILELIADFSESINLSREEISHVPAHVLLDLAKSSSEDTAENTLKELATIESEKHEISCSIRLPQLLIDNSGVYVIPFQVSHPNFITNKKITAPTVVLLSDVDAVNLTDKIVIIEGADPGFDWIFSQKIAGLITKYGGANSHMAIRCAEFGIPAAIGCGEQRFELLLKGKQVHLDCAAGLIAPVH